MVLDSVVAAYASKGMLGGQRWRGSEAVAEVFKLCLSGDVIETRLFFLCLLEAIGFYSSQGM